MRVTWKKVGRFFMHLCTTGTVLSVLSAWWVETANQKGLRDLRRQMRAEGLPLTPADLKRPLPAADQNAATVYRQLTHLLNSHPLVGDDLVLHEIGRDVPARPDTMQQVRLALARRQDIIQLVHAAAARPQCVFNRDYAAGFNLTFPEAAKMRDGLRVLTNESILLLHDGKPLDAIRNETLGFRMAQHAASDPCLISKLVGIGLNATTLKFMERVLYTAGDQPGVAQAVEKAIAQDWKSVSIAEGMRGEIVIDEVTFADLRAGTLRDADLKPGEQPKSAAPNPPSAWGQAILTANELHLLQYLHQSLALASLPPRESEAKLDALDQQASAYARLPTRMIAALLRPVYTQARSRQTQGEAQAAVVRAAASVLDYKQRHGAFPDALAQAMPSVPIDPFNSQPLSYLNASAGFLIYSVGRTGKFDGGTPETKPDSYESVFHFPMPAYYTQRASPAQK